MRPVVIAAAIAGSVPCKKDNPAVPVTVAEQVESPIKPMKLALCWFICMCAIRMRALPRIRHCLPE